MPTKPKQPCKHTGCPELTNGKYCAIHEKIHSNDRPCARERGYDNRWRKASKRFLNSNPLCRRCLREGKVTQATVVDHVVPHRGDKILFWDESNWQPLCKTCHDRKTRTEDQIVEYHY